LPFLAWAASVTACSSWLVLARPRPGFGGGGPDRDRDPRWIGSYLFRVVTGNMTYMQQRRDYRSRYEAATEDELQTQFEALPLAEQEKLLRELGRLGDSADR
jgi:hypothetical protein